MYTPNFKPQVLSVSQLNFYIKSVLENDPRLTAVFLEGEISNLSLNNRSGHMYFSIKDQKAVVRAVMFAGNARRLAFLPENGMKIICHGRVSVYEPSGQYQMIVENMQPEGVGALALAYEQLKRELEEKGLFDRAHKKPIPSFPKTIGVITSPTGAAVRDIRNILGRRFPYAKIVLCPVLVQGGEAVPQLVRAVELLGEHRACDVIIIGRGGGSMEDLWAFNSRELAMAIYNCPIPVISAVGHETDFTICDFVADLRAPTPSAAAELAVPDSAELLAQLSDKLRVARACVAAKLDERAAVLEGCRVRAGTAIMQKHIEPLAVQCDSHSASLKATAAVLTHDSEKQLVALKSRLEALDPEKVLARGFALVEKDGEPIYSASMLNGGDEITMHFSDGKKEAKITGD